jgi:hypothetical protein
MYSFGVVLWELVTKEIPRRGCLRDVLVPEECPQVRKCDAATLKPLQI